MTVQPDTVQRAREEHFRWDEENRLAALSQNGYVSHYWYDADGERDKRTVPVSELHPKSFLSNFWGHFSHRCDSKRVEKK